jgi:hypothetical protein
MRGYFCQDDAGHWYLIPKEKVDRFIGLLRDLYLAEWEDRQRIAENIIDEFEKYRISGGVGDYEVTINE